MKFLAAVPACAARWRAVWSLGGSIAVLAVGSACASSPPPASGSAYFAARPEAYAGRVVGDGHCVDFVKVAAGAPLTSEWRKGPHVQGNPQIAPGTAIATFEADGTYTSRTGNHAAIYLGQDESGIWVMDQWRGQPVHKRLIRFEGGKGSQSGSKSNNGRLFSVVR